MSFKNCVRMRKLDFSDNRLGDKGIETLLRVYSREMKDITFDEEGWEDVLDEPLSRSISKMSTRSDNGNESDDGGDLTMTGSQEYGTSPASSLAASAVIKSNRRGSENPVSIPTRGLRSIAYIRLHNVGMTDLSALHLTYLLPYHPLPHVLLRRLDAQILDPSSGREDELYDKDSLCRGVVYDIDKSDLTPLGKKVLESVEKVRRAGGMQPRPPFTLPSPLTPHTGAVPPSPDSIRARRGSDSSRGYFPETPSPTRKESVASIRTMASSHGRSGSISLTPTKVDIMPHWTDILKTRPKLQGELLKNSGNVHISQLWSAGIKLLSLSRTFTLPTIPLPSSITTSRSTKQGYPVKVSLPPSPVSPGTPRLPRLNKSTGVGGLEKKVWMRILLPVADPSGILSERQAMHIIDWAADRTTLAKEGEWAGKLPHVQMWKLLDVN